MFQYCDDIVRKPIDKLTLLNVINKNWFQKKFVSKEIQNTIKTADEDYSLAQIKRI